MLLTATRDDQCRLATTASPTGIFLIDGSGELTFANPRLLEMARVPAHRLLGLGFLRYVHPQRLLAAVEEAAALGGYPGRRWASSITDAAHQRCWPVTSLHRMQEITPESSARSAEHRALRAGFRGRVGCAWSWERVAASLGVRRGHGSGGRCGRWPR